ncbi:hypothetical protein DRF65_16495 [Chryseobacterium pennae]|uniref:Uncharacterized protein n=1 Tax=Chryseobacterium pennae TaxID=2258962 RepID=A0A3D9C6D3_9FLAO|nr:hypothetical protein [Chryseobacterium pennae]REC61314.1 hypothetical protein DRF65_16495 [Chryseobacterium pennae]
MKKTKDIINFFEHVIGDSRLHPSHISMYVALFQLWGRSGFKNPFRIYREEVMKLSMIKSTGTYHKCIRKLNTVGFINYLPSYNPYIGSLIEMIDLENHKITKNRSAQKQKSLPEEHDCFSPPMYYEIELYFRERDISDMEAAQFYSFYHCKNWKLSGNKPMKCWQAAARNWISKANKTQSR